MTVETPDPRTWVNTDLGRAALLNDEMRDPLDFIVSSCQTSAQKSANQTINSGVYTDIAWDSLDDDVDGLINIPDSVFTFTRSGVISVRAKVTLDAVGGATGSRRQLTAYYNDGTGWDDIISSTDGTSTRYAQIPLSLDLPVNVGDQLKLVIFQDSGNPQTLYGIGTYAVLRWVGSIEEWEDADTPAPPPAPGQSPPPTPPAPRKRIRPYDAIWSRTYNSSGNTTWDDSPYCYQGYYSQARGNNRSLAGFNWSQIKADLNGATRISATLTYHVVHSFWNKGMVVVIGAHDYSSKPATWSWSHVNSALQAQFTAPGTTKTIDLVSAIISGLKTGSYKGIAFGPGPTTSLNYYGYLNGATQSNKPKLEVTYYK